MKKRRNISLDEDTNEKLKRLAKEDHKSVSQWITDKVWNEKEIMQFSHKSKQGLVK